MIQSTVIALEDFKEGFVWKDIEAELLLWEEDVSSMYGECEDLLELGRIQGRLEALGYFKSLPDVLILNRKEFDESLGENLSEDEDSPDDG